jgi:hypothetical protein
VHLNLNLNQLRLDQLQEAIHANLVSFPSQVPAFIKHAEGKLQCRMVLLYFVMDWSCDKIAKRYGFTRQHVWQTVSDWKRHAIALGYLQVISPPEVLRPFRPVGIAIPVPCETPVPVQVVADVPVLV